MDFKEVCRTCLANDGSLRSIFSSIQLTNIEDTEVPILEMLEVFDILVSPTDSLPDKICSDCLKKLQQSYTFKLEFDQSQSIWMQIKDKRKGVNYLKEDGISTEEIKSENCFTSKIELQELASISNSEQGLTKKETLIVQKVKQEPEIHINIEEVNSAGKTLKTRKIKCAICSKLFQKKYKLHLHMRIHTGKKPFQCRECPSQVKNSLNKHMQCVHEHRRRPIARKVKCSKCSKLFKSKKHLNVHMRIHSEEKPFQCEVCSQKYRFKTSLTEHIYAKHADTMTNTVKYTCEICSKLYRQKCKLEEHMRIHTGEKPFQCEVCPIKYRLKGSLQKHILRSHADIIPNSIKFECAPCSKLFESKARLHDHMTIHTGEQPFQCKVCMRKFRTKSSLRNHTLIIHADLAPRDCQFKCTMCSKVFVCQRRLDDHIRIHTGEQPFRCEVCLRTFRLKRSLWSHVQRIHGDTGQFKCKMCTKLFQSEVCLNEHILIHVGGKSLQCEVQNNLDNCK